jgi:NAD(P)-dependent dehydrogenase (short-subunit alcohol dehydrogenase family)
MNPYESKVAIVTGAASGMGRELVRQLAAGGATVIASDIDGKSLEESVRALGSLGGRVRSEVLDVADAVRFRKIIGTTAREFGRLDFMFNNAGIAIFGEVSEMNRGQWEKIVNINLWGVINGTTAAYEVMVKQGHGAIVNTASAAGLAPIPMMTAYAMTKHAVVGLSTSLRAEAVQFGVQVNVVCPGVVNTNILGQSHGMKADLPLLRAMNPVGELPVEKAVERILAGVAANEGVIIFPASAKMLDLLIRLRRGLHEPLWQRGLRRMRGIPQVKG